MKRGFGFFVASVIVLGLWHSGASLMVACCPAGPAGKAVVNADQTVVMIWDAARQTQHFIRQASFKSEADDIGFLVPTPSQPELEEAGNEAFPLLAKITAPEIQRVPRPSSGMSCACSAPPPTSRALTDSNVSVLAEKRVAGFDAQVLEATSAESLVAWLNEHGYSFSPEVEAWAQPYIEEGWKFTALRVAKDEQDQANPNFAASALRISFQTDRPLFPYREPDPAQSAESLHAQQRLLRVFFLADSRYQGELTKESPWTGTVAWSNRISSDDRRQLLEKLRLPEQTGPAEFWLTEFEDHWPYQAAPADVYFSRSASQETVKRPPQIQYVQSETGGEGTLLVFVACVIGPLIVGRCRKRRRD